MLACASKSYNASTSTMTKESSSAYDYAAMEMNYDEGEEYYVDNLQDITESYGDSNITYERKLIQNANINMSTFNVEEAYTRIIEYVNSKGGYEFTKNLSSSRDYTSIYATIKVLPATLDDVISYISTCGTINSTNKWGEDVTSDYYDTKTRLENKRKNLEKYYEYLAEAATLEELVMLQNEIDRITSDIEIYEGRIKLWDSLVNESTLELRIYQENDPDAIQEEFKWDSLSLKSMGRMISNGFKKTCNVIFSILQWIVIIVMTILPLLIILAIVVIVIMVSLRKNRKKQENGTKENKDQMPRDGIDDNRM